MYHDILFSRFFLAKQQQKKDLKGILSDGLCFSMEKRVIFLLRNMKCKDYVSCWNDASKANLHTENEVMFIVDKKKTKKKRLLSFLHMFSKVQYLKGLMTVSDN